MGPSLEWLIRAEQRLKPDGGTLWWVALRGTIAEWLRTGERVVMVDAGCGIKRSLSLERDRQHCFAVGVDPDPEGAGNPDVDCFVRARVEQLPLASGSADVLLSSYVLEHLADPARALREVGRVLKPGGRAALWTSNRLNYSMIAASLTPTRFHNWIRRRAFPYLAKENAPTFYRANTRWALSRCIRDAGLVPEGPILYGAGAYHYWRFSKPLFVLAALASRLATATPLRCLKAVLVARCVKPPARASDNPDTTA